MAGMEASTAVAMTELQSFTYVPMYGVEAERHRAHVLGRGEGEGEQEVAQENRKVNRAAVMSALRLIGSTMETNVRIVAGPVHPAGLEDLAAGCWP